MNMRASVERAWKFFAFSHSKTAISFIGTSDTLSQKHNIFRSQITICMIHDIINAVRCYYLWYGVIYKRQYTDKTLTLRKSMNMRASELGNFLHFHSLKLLFPSIFCWYF